MLLYEILNNKKTHVVYSFGECDFDLFSGWCLLCGQGDEFAESVIYHSH